MNRYSIKDLNTVWNAKMYLPMDRFVHYFTLRYGYSEKEAVSAYAVFSEFPKYVHGNEEMQSRIDEIIPLALQLVNELHRCWDMNRDFKNLSYDDKEIRKLVYKKDGVLKEVVLNLHDSNDIITYAELLRQGIEPVALLRFVDEVKMKNTDKVLQIFEGDFFDTNDLFFGVKSNVYVAEKGGVFRKLLYTKGKGYLRNGELNYDEGTFNSYCLSLREWVKIGNVTTDLIVLTDDGVGL